MGPASGKRLLCIGGAAARQPGGAFCEGGPLRAACRRGAGSAAAITCLCRRVVCVDVCVLAWPSFSEGHLVSASQRRPLPLSPFAREAPSGDPALLPNRSGGPAKDSAGCVLGAGHGIAGRVGSYVSAPAAPEMRARAPLLQQPIRGAP